MLRVALLCEFPTVNGGERSLLAMLAALRQRVEPIVLAPAAGQLATELERAGLTHQPFETRDAAGQRRPTPDLLEELRSLVDRWRPQLLHANSLSMARLTGEVATLLSCPCTGHLRDIVGLSRAAVSAINGNRRLFAVSQATANFHIAQGLDPSRVTVLHNGIDLSAFHPCADPDERLALRRRFGIADETLWALTIGQIGIRKGLDTLLPAMAQVMPRYPALRLGVVGERYSNKPEAVEYEQRLHQFVQAHGLAARVDWLGYRDDIPNLLRAADLLIHPARQEPFGRVLLEAAACALPIVATRVGGTEEMLEHEASALLVPPDSPGDLARAIDRLSADELWRYRVGTSARKQVAARFDIAAAADRLLAHWIATATL